LKNTFLPSHFNPLFKIYYAETFENFPPNFSAHPHIRSSSSCGGGSNQESEKCKKIKKIVGLVGGSDFSRCVSNFFFP